MVIGIYEWAGMFRGGENAWRDGFDSPALHCDKELLLNKKRYEKELK